MAYLVSDACTACGACLLTCPEHAFVVGVPLTVRDDRCTDCGECVEVCPADAITRLAPLPPLPGPRSRQKAHATADDHGISALIGGTGRVA